GAVGIDAAGATSDDACGREIRTGDMSHQLIDADVGVGDQRQATVDHLAQVVWGDVGRHAHGDPAGAVDQQDRNLGRHDRRNLLGTVVVRYPVHGFLVQVGQQLMGQPGHAHFGVTHGRGAVAIDRTEVALAVDQQVAQREWLGHTDDGVVNRRVAVRVVFTDHVTHDTGRLLVRLVPVVTQFAHGKQHTAMHGFQTVSRIRQRPSDDYAHGVVEIGLLEFVFDIDREDFFG